MQCYYYTAFAVDCKQATRFRKDEEEHGYNITYYTGKLRRRSCQRIQAGFAGLLGRLVRSPTIEELAQEYCGKIRVGKINIDEQPTLALLHRVVSIPTVSIYSEGKEVKRLIGLRDKPELVEAIQEVLKK